MKCPYENIECTQLEMAGMSRDVNCVDCLHYNRGIRATGALPELGRRGKVMLAVVCLVLSFFGILKSWDESLAVFSIICLAFAVSGFWLINLICKKYL